MPGLVLIKERLITLMVNPRNSSAAWQIAEPRVVSEHDSLLPFMREHTLMLQSCGARQPLSHEGNCSGLLAFAVKFLAGGLCRAIVSRSLLLSIY